MRPRSLCLFVSALLVGAVTVAHAEAPARRPPVAQPAEPGPRFAVPPPQPGVPAPPSGPVPRVATAEPEVNRPVRWLLTAQNEDGGWGDGVRTKADVATTAISGMATMRLQGLRGSPMMAAGREATRKAVGYVVRAVEHTPAGEIAIERGGTQPQRKLGRYIDTFLGAQFLAEAIERVPDLPEKPRVRAALQSLVGRIERAQKADGSYATDGWAPVLSSAFANEGLEAAERAKATVKVEVLAKGDRFMLNNFDAKTGSFGTRGSAGVGLYATAAGAKSAARSGQIHSAAGRAAMGKLNDDRFLRGFGSYGGEEHVSYMLTTEALAKVGGTAWQTWSRNIRTRLAGIQRADGTWRGDHCITSTTFCTAASLLTLVIQPAGA